VLGNAVKVKGCSSLLAPLIWNRINAFVHLDEDCLFNGGQKNIGSVVFLKVGGKHAFPSYLEAGSFKMRDLFGAGEGKGHLCK
jgi:hypothetical protein